MKENISVFKRSMFLSFTILSTHVADAASSTEGAYPSEAPDLTSLMKVHMSFQIVLFCLEIVIGRQATVILFLMITAPLERHFEKKTQQNLKIWS